MKSFPRVVINQDAPPSLCTQINKGLEALAVEFKSYPVSQDYTFKTTDAIDTLYVNATAGNITVNLPDPTGSRRRRVIKTDVSANTVTVAAPTTLINGAGSVVLNAQYAYVWVEPTGTEWYIIGS